MFLYNTHSYDNIKIKNYLRFLLYIIVGCDSCQKSLPTTCTIHKQTVIKDKEVLTRAWATLPTSFNLLRISTLENQPLGKI